MVIKCLSWSYLNDASSYGLLMKAGRAGTWSLWKVHELYFYLGWLFKWTIAWVNGVKTCSMTIASTLSMVCIRDLQKSVVSEGLNVIQ